MEYGYQAAIAFVSLGLLAQLVLKSRPSLGAKIGTYLVGVAIIPLLAFPPDFLNFVLATLILFLSGIVHSFSLRYMEGDRKFRSYFLKLSAITLSVLLLVAADHLLLLLFLWAVSNALLSSLMVHKKEWEAARNGGRLFGKRALFGFFSLTVGVGVLAYCAQTLSLHEIGERLLDVPRGVRLFSLFAIAVAALIQSGVWPFHRWLLSSLNSPTPVSALMHAGLVNGGGLLLVRFSSLFSLEKGALFSLFFLGVISIVLGTFWKLIQSNVKKMLACSTIAQMGFMWLQCGLGLFSAAVAHLCWHGLFKAFLFLNSGSAIEEKKRLPGEKIRGAALFLAPFCALFGVFGFGRFAYSSFDPGSTQTILLLFAWASSIQIAFSLFRGRKLFPGALFSSLGTLLFGSLYGATIYGIDHFLPFLSTRIPLHPLHFVGAACALFPMSLIRSKWLYMKMRSQSQSDPKTVTSIRNEYQY